MACPWLHSWPVTGRILTLDCLTPDLSQVDGGLRQRLATEEAVEGSLVE